MGLDYPLPPLEEDYHGRSLNFHCDKTDSLLFQLSNLLQQVKMSNNSHAPISVDLTVTGCVIAAEFQLESFSRPT